MYRLQEDCGRRSSHSHRVCAGAREMSPLSVHVMSCMWRTAEELKQIWQKSHQPVRKCQLCNLDVSTACMRWLNVWVFGHMQSYVCISGCVYTCNCYLWCLCVCAHACVCMMYVRAPAETAARDAPASTCQLGEQLEAQWEGGGITVCEKKRRKVSNNLFAAFMCDFLFSACSWVLSWFWFCSYSLLFRGVEVICGTLVMSVNYCSFLTQRSFFSF